MYFILAALAAVSLSVSRWGVQDFISVEQEAELR